MDNTEIDIPNHWELICDYSPTTRDVKYMYYNNENEESSSELPQEIHDFIVDTHPDEWTGHLSTSYVPFKPFYTHIKSNFSIWHQPQCLKELCEGYTDNFDDWSIRSKKLEMTPEIRVQILDFDNTVVLSANPTAMEQFQYDLLQNNRRRYLSTGKVSPQYVCFYRNNITKQCLFELPPILDQFQLKSTSHREWTPQISSTIDRFFYTHQTGVSMWDTPLAYRLNRDKHIQNATKDDWRIFVSSEHKKPLYIHTKSKITQFELPEPLKKAEEAITSPSSWSSGINPITNLPYYYTTNIENVNLTLWHLPSALEKIKKEFNKRRQNDETLSKKEKKSFIDLDYIYWGVQFVSYQPRAPASGSDNNPTSSTGEKYILYYKHRYTQECTLDLPPSIVSFAKSTKKDEWIKVNIKDTPVSYFEHNKPIEKDPYKLMAPKEQPEGVEQQQQQPDEDEGVCMWTSPLDIITNHAKVIQQTEAQLVVSSTSNNFDDIQLDPEDDIDNWIIYYDPNAPTNGGHETLKSAAKAKQRKASTSTSQSTEDEFYGGGLISKGPYDDDDDDDNDLGGGLISMNGGSGLGDLISSATNYQLQGLRLDQISSLSKLSPKSATTTLNNSSMPRTELEEGMEIGNTDGPGQRRLSFSTFSFSTTQRHLNLSQRGQQLYFNTITKRLQPELPNCFELFQKSIDDDNPNNWESVVGKIAPFPFYRFKHQKSIVMWHEPICVRDYRTNVYSVQESEDLESTLKDWSVRLVAETNSVYYKNTKTLWYQNEIPEVLDEYQAKHSNHKEWESVMSNVCIGIVIYCHVLPNGDTGCSILQRPDCLKARIPQVDTSITSSTPVSVLDTRFNAVGTSYRDNVLNWSLQYNSCSNTTFYRNHQTQCLSINIPKPLYLLGTSPYSTYQDWDQALIYFDSDGDIMSKDKKDELDKQIEQNPSLVKNGKKLYTEKSCYVYKLNPKIKVFHRPVVLRNYLRQIESTFDWLLIRSTDNSHFLYKNKTTNELTAQLPQSIDKWLKNDVEAQKSELWVGCVDTTLKQAYYKHKPTNLMVISEHEPPVLKEIRERPYTLEQSLAQWSIFANKVDNRCYYQNKITKQCIIGSIPKVLLEYSCATNKAEWKFVEPTGTISKGYWYHLKSGVRMWERPNFMDDKN